jgi:signal transduction histidine kinase
MNIARVVTAITLAVALAVSGAAAWMMLRDARADAARDVTAALAMTTTDHLQALQAIPAVESAKLYGARGNLIAQFVREGSEGRAAAEVACQSVTASGSPATLCIESSNAAIAPVQRNAITLIAAAAIAAILIGWLLGRALSRSVAAPLQRMTDVLDKAAREHAYSLRVEPGSKLAGSVNELLAQMQERDVELRRRSTELEAANKELESFAYSVSHDLRAPLGSIDGFSYAIELDYSERLDETGREYLAWIRKAATQMRDLIDGLLQMTRLSRAEVQREPVDLTAIARDVAGALRKSDPQREVRFDIREGVQAVGDARLLQAVVENLMSNAWKFTRNRDVARIEFGTAGGAYFVRDNGAGFDPSLAAKMFRPFQRLHSTREFEGTGIGLATVQKIIERHGGRAWAEGEVEKGATVYFTV